MSGGVTIVFGLVNGESVTADVTWGTFDEFAANMHASTSGTNLTAHSMVVVTEADGNVVAMPWGQVSHIFSKGAQS